MSYYKCKYLKVHFSHFFNFLQINSHFNIKKIYWKIVLFSQELNSPCTSYKLIDFQLHIEWILTLHRLVQQWHLQSSQSSRISHIFITAELNSLKTKLLICYFYLKKTINLTWEFKNTEYTIVFELTHTHTSTTVILKIQKTCYNK